MYIYASVYIYNIMISPHSLVLLQEATDDTNQGNIMPDAHLIESE